MPPSKSSTIINPRLATAHPAEFYPSVYHHWPVVPPPQHPPQLPLLMPELRTGHASTQQTVWYVPYYSQQQQPQQQQQQQQQQQHCHAGFPSSTSTPPFPHPAAAAAAMPGYYHHYFNPSFSSALPAPALPPWTAAAPAPPHRGYWGAAHAPLQLCQHPPPPPPPPPPHQQHYYFYHCHHQQQQASHDASPPHPLAAWAQSGSKEVEVVRGNTVLTLGRQGADRELLLLDSSGELIIQRAAVDGACGNNGRDGTGRRTSSSSGSRGSRTRSVRDGDTAPAADMAASVSTTAAPCCGGGGGCGAFLSTYGPTCLVCGEGGARRAPHPKRAACTTTTTTTTGTAAAGKGENIGVLADDVTAPTATRRLSRRERRNRREAEVEARRPARAPPVPGPAQSPTQLIVNYLDDAASGPELLRIFTAIGPVDSVRIMHDPESGAPLGYGFVYMADEKNARVAVSRLNRYTLRKKRLKVSFANLLRRDRVEHDMAGDQAAVATATAVVAATATTAMTTPLSATGTASVDDMTTGSPCSDGQ